MTEYETHVLATFESRLQNIVVNSLAQLIVLGIYEKRLCLRLRERFHGVEVNEPRVRSSLELEHRTAIALQQTCEEGLYHLLRRDEATHSNDARNLGVKSRNIHGRERAPAVSHYRDVIACKARIRLDGADAIVEVAERMRETAGRLAARFHTTGVIVCKYGVAVRAELLDLLHIGLVSSAESVVEYHEPIRLGRVVVIDISLQSVSLRGGEWIRLGHKTGEILGREVEYRFGVVATGIHHTLERIYNLLFEYHNFLR